MFNLARCFSVGPVVKNMPAKVDDTGNMGLSPGVGRSPGGGHGHLLQYSCLENPMDREDSGGLQSMETQKSQT